MTRFLVKYIDDLDDENTKTFGIKAKSKVLAAELVTIYIEETNFHPSINYGFSLRTIPSNEKADIEIPDEWNN